MKQKFTLLIFLAFVCKGLIAQVPQGIPYQSVIRNSSGTLVANQTVKMRFSIHDSITSGTVVYQETFSTTTSSLGLANVNIGMGTIVSGTFSGINWGKNSKFIQVEMDPTGGTNYTDMGTTQMMSVPYALYANISGSTLTSKTYKAKGTIAVNAGSGVAADIPEMSINFTPINDHVYVHFSMNSGSLFMGEYKIILDGSTVAGNGWYYDVSNIPCTNPTINDFLILYLTPNISHNIKVTYSTANWNNPGGYTSTHAFFINNPNNGAYRNLFIEDKD